MNDSAAERYALGGALRARRGPSESPLFAKLGPARDAVYIHALRQRVGASRPYFLSIFLISSKPQ